MAKIIHLAQRETRDKGLARGRKTTWQMLRDVLRGKYRLSLLATVTAVISIGYIIFPFDLVPDYIPVLGWLDDGTVFYVLVWVLRRETQRYIRQKAMDRRLQVH